MSTDMSSVNNTNRIEVITGVQRRRRWTTEQKLKLVKQTFEAGMTVSVVARQVGIAATQLFQWKKAYSDGSLVAVGANEPVVPASDMVEALKRIKQLEGALGRKTLESEILKEVVEHGKARKCIARWPCLQGTSSKSCLLCSWCFAQPCHGSCKTTVHVVGPTTGSAQV
jgi:transposase